MKKPKRSNRFGCSRFYFKDFCIAVGGLNCGSMMNVRDSLFFLFEKMKIVHTGCKIWGVRDGFVYLFLGLRYE